MATHSSILTWRIPWTEEHRELQSMGLQRVRHNWVTNIHTQHQQQLEPSLVDYRFSINTSWMNEWMNEQTVGTQISVGIRDASMNQIKSLRCSELDRLKYACLRKGREGQRQKVKFYSGDCCGTLLSILAVFFLCFLSLSFLGRKSDTLLSAR